MNNTKMTKISERHILFTHDLVDWTLTNHLIIGEMKNYLIDTGLGSLSMQPIKEFLNNDSKPLIVINSHYHWDHVWGNGEFKNHLVVSHDLCRQLMSNNWQQMIAKNGQFKEGNVEMYLPNLTFNDQLIFPEDQLYLYHTPGHTVDTISVWDDKEKILNISDNIGDDLSELLPSLEVEKNIFRKTISEYIEMKPKLCISGHIEMVDPEVLKQLLLE
ncbi:MBL fold metallo-hydrolase [Enterococcus sp. LJL99]